MRRFQEKVLASCVAMLATTFLLLLFGGCVQTSGKVAFDRVIKREALSGDVTPPRKARVVVAKRLQDLGDFMSLSPLRESGALKAVDFDRSFLVLVSRGSRMSSGYLIELDTAEFDASSKTLTLNLKDLTPEQTRSGGDAEITYPCLLL